MPKGVYPRRPSLINPSKAPKKPTKKTTYTKTCPTCAETFKAKRKDKVFCCDVHRTYFNQGEIPKAIQEKADRLRAPRTERARVAKEKRDQEKATIAANHVILEKARELYLEADTQNWNDQIAKETDPVEKAEMIRIRDEGLARIKDAVSVPDRYMKTARVR